MKSVVCGFLWSAALTFSGIGSSFAGSPPNITNDELALLPAYCPYTQSFPYGIKAAMQNHPTAERWRDAVGPAFMDLHHYCWALIELNRAARSTTPRQAKEGLRQSALGNLWYVMKKNPEGLELAPEILTWIGRTELLLAHPSNAQSAFDKARELKPDYWPAYFHWGEYLLSRGMLNDANAITEAGLENCPNAKALVALRDAIRKKGLPKKKRSNP